jgi:hypothetical protein
MWIEPLVVHKGALGNNVSVFRDLKVCSMDLFRPEAEGRREVYPPVLLYFLFSACVRTLGQHRGASRDICFACLLRPCSSFLPRTLQAFLGLFSLCCFISHAERTAPMFSAEAGSRGREATRASPDAWVSCWSTGPVLLGGQVLERFLGKWIIWASRSMRQG